jgi:Transposase IS4
MSDKAVGEDDVMTGMLDGETYHVFVLKDHGYIGIMMSTYGTKERMRHETTRCVNGEKVTFDYPEVFSNHYKFRSFVDHHNGLRHSPIGLETTWGTKQWEKRVFAFVLAVTEVNVFIASQFFYHGNHASMLDFRGDLAKELIENKYITEEETAETPFKRRMSSRSAGWEEHQLLSLPKKNLARRHRRCHQ